MPTRKRAAEEAVRLIPMPGAYITGEPAAEREVTPQEAERLLSFYPSAYRRAPAPVPVPEVADEPDPPITPTVDAVDEPEPQE